jgi:hypothetical protein
MKKVMSIGMALVFVFFVASAMAADICPLKSALPEAETSFVQMTNSELSAVQGGWGWSGVRTFKRFYIPPFEPDITSNTSTSQSSTTPDNNQVNNIDINTSWGASITFDSRTSNEGYEEIRISWPSLTITKKVPPDAP